MYLYLKLLLLLLGLMVVLTLLSEWLLMLEMRYISYQRKTGFNSVGAFLSLLQPRMSLEQWVSPVVLYFRLSFWNKTKYICVLRRHLVFFDVCRSWFFRVGHLLFWTLNSLVRSFDRESGSFPNIWVGNFDFAEYWVGQMF
jgi:hypothetical protein